MKPLNYLCCRRTYVRKADGKGLFCMAKRKEDIKVIVTYTEGCEKRYTEAYMKVLVAQEKKEISPPPEIAGLVQKV